MADFLFLGGVSSAMPNGLTLLFGIWFLYVILLGLYNLFLHPLRSYPGPLLWRAYRLPWTFSVLSGRLPLDALELHKKYGHVVRVAPDELSYTDSRALKPIYGHHNPVTEGFSEFDKDRREYPLPLNGVWNLLGAFAPDHGRMRRMFSPSFSEKGMRDMQPRIQSHVELLMKGLKEAAATGVYTDMLQWYNWTTFDILGDLAFGQSFHCLEKKQSDPWIDVIFGNVKAAVIILVMKRYYLNWLLPYITPKRLLEQRAINAARNEHKMNERIQQGTERGDFWDKVIEKSDFEKGTGMTKDEMVNNGGLLVLGGSETTATLLSGTTYMLLKHPEVMKKLVDEVRGAFKSENEIDLMSVGRLDYMLAVLDESLRIYPPTPNVGNRLVPPGGAMVAGKWVPGGTSVQVQQYSANHSPSNFARPDDFVPARWLTNPPAEFANDDRAARAPFLLGPRNCIGRTLAYAEMRLVLAKVIFNFDLELDEEKSGNWVSEQKIYAMWEKGPLWVKLTAAKL